jgi:hypothetical protein
LGVFLDASHDLNVMSPRGRCGACFELAAENKDPQMTRARALHHRFCRESADWGHRELVRKVDAGVDTIVLFCSYCPLFFVMS